MARPPVMKRPIHSDGMASRLGKALFNRMFDRPLYTKGDPMADVRAGARGAYNDQVKPFVDFARRPGIMTGAGAAAIALPVPFLAKSLKVGLSPEGRAIAKALNKQVDSRIVPFSRDIRGELNMVAADPRKGVNYGGFYGTPGFKGEFGQFVDDRTAIIQDPETGVMFMAPGAIHGELIKWVAKNYPQFAKGNPQRWMQHEVYAPTVFDTGLDPVPARIMFALAKEGAVDADNMQSTVARARLMHALAKRGVRQDEGLAKWLEMRLGKPYQPKRHQKLKDHPF